ncbi:MAG TPA: proline racemase family protein [Candidatus Limnocylindrales bacterium]|nr:proline racemase family protein [Candidatus Limnocylindrales bacterium]
MKWKPPESWMSITAIDAHTGGEPLRIYTSGYPDLPGASILAKKRYAQEYFDHLRTATMWEPRGHADMYGCLVTEPVTADGHFGVLFLHNEGYSSMCGHGIIAIVKVVLETGLVAIAAGTRSINIDTPAGRVTAEAHWDNDRVKEVSFLNVPSFVYLLDQTIEIPGLGPINYDIVYGGAFYALVSAEETGVKLTAHGFRRLIELGSQIKQAIIKNVPISHPFENDLGFLYGVIFIGKAEDPAHHSRNVCVFADGEVDRSPTGTGVSARCALHYARGELAIGEQIVVESIIGSCFSGEVVEATSFGTFKAVIPKVTGSAYISGVNTMFIDPEDPLRYGFILR